MLTVISWISLIAAFVCAAIIAADELRRPQKMWIMNIVWPATALYLSIFALFWYFRRAPAMSKGAERHMDEGMGDASRNRSGKGSRSAPAWAQTALATSHCGAGCVLGDIGSEFAIFALGLTLWGSPLWASYVVDFIVAWSLGVLFQYFTLFPMGKLSPEEALRAAVKADTLSITAFQIGMYGWMAVVFFLLFPNPHLHANRAAYWFMMQIAMSFGFVTSFPMNRFLIRIGWKEVMG